MPKARHDALVGATNRAAPSLHHWTPRSDSANGHRGSQAAGVLATRSLRARPRGEPNVQRSVQATAGPLTSGSAVSCLAGRIPADRLLVPRAYRSEGSFDAPSSGEGVERPALCTGLTRAFVVFYPSILVNRGTSGRSDTMRTEVEPPRE